MDYKNGNLPHYINEKEVAAVFCKTNKVTFILRNSSIAFDIDFTYQSDAIEFANNLIEGAKYYKEEKL